MKTRPVAKAKPPRSFKLPFKAPPRAWALAEWSLIPLRLFLGVTFLYASLQKLANPDFVHASSGISIQHQLKGAVTSSPLGALIRPLLHIAVPLGIGIAIIEVAVAVGTLLGLWGRVAALGGALLSLGLFFTISFHTSPYYFGSDIVFFFAWLPLIISGSGSRLSMDAVLARRAAHGASVPDPELVVMPFSQVQHLCGHFNAGKCKVQHNAPCQPHGCPVLEGARPSLPTRGRIDHVDRRAVVLGATSAAVVSAITAVAAGAAGGVGWVLHRKNPKKSAGGSVIGTASKVTINSAASFTVPSNGDPGIVICTQPGQYVAYDAVCTHAGCTVGYSPSAKVIACPCHGSQFSVDTGAVVAGPAPSPLKKFTVTEGSDGKLYLT